jgi:protein transport protein SEC31
MTDNNIRTNKKKMQVVWNPEMPTQFVITNDESNIVNLCDLRMPEYPVETFSNVFSEGITSISWCLNDSNLLLGSDKSGSTVCFHSKTGERITEFPTKNVYEKVEFSNHMKGMITTHDDKGGVNILSLTSEGAKQASSQPIAQEKIYAPTWLQPPVGARFGFGNKLLSFGKVNFKLNFLETR